MFITLPSVPAIPFTDNSGFYVSGYMSPDGNKFCKYIYTFSTSTAEWQSVGKINGYLSYQMVSQNQFVLIGNDGANKNVIIYKQTFGSTSVEWADKIACSTSVWALGISEMILSSDASTMYSFTPYGLGFTTNFYFLAFSSSTGSAIGSRYMSTDSIYMIYNWALNNDYVICTTPTFMILYKISTSTFQIRNFPKYYFGVVYEQSFGQ